MAYIAPDNNNITFNFEKLGYNSPNSNNTIFSLGVEHSTYQIKSSIVGTLLQRDYLKSKEVNVIGYSLYRVQILRRNYIYGGIRDLNAFIDVRSGQKDLYTLIKLIKSSNRYE